VVVERVDMEDQPTKVGPIEVVLDAKRVLVAETKPLAVDGLVELKSSFVLERTRVLVAETSVLLAAARVLVADTTTEAVVVGVSCGTSCGSAIAHALSSSAVSIFFNVDMLIS
jgi:hypothetical protein